MTNLPAFKLVVPADFEYVDNTLATASWYDKYIIKAGEYPVTLVNTDYLPVERIEDAYYAKWTVDAIKTEEYRVNRLFTASSSQTDRPMTECKFSDSCYAYEVLKPRNGESRNVWSVGDLDENGKYHVTVNATIVPA